MTKLVPCAGLGDGLHLLLASHHHLQVYGFSSTDVSLPDTKIECNIIDIAFIL